MAGVVSIAQVCAGRPFGVLWGFFIAIPIVGDIDLMDDLYLLRDAATETFVMENFVKAVARPALNSAIISAFCDPRRVKESPGIASFGPSFLLLGKGTRELLR